MTGTASRPRATRDRSLPATPRAHARVQPPPLSSSHRRVARYISSGWGEAPLVIRPWAALKNGIADIQI